MNQMLRFLFLAGLFFVVISSGLSQNIPVSGGTAFAYTLAYPANTTAYEIGMNITFKAFVVNGHGVTINVNSMGPVLIKNTAGDSLAANDIKAGQLVTITYDGTNFQMTTTSGNIVAGGGSNQWITNGPDIYRSTGNVGIGIVSPTVTLHVLDISASSTARGILSDRLAEDAGGAQLNLRKARPSGIFSSQDILGELNFIGTFPSGSPPHRRTAAISARASETWTTGGNGTYMVFETTPNGTSSLIERMRITNNGNVGIGAVPGLIPGFGKYLSLVSIDGASSPGSGTSTSASFEMQGGSNDVNGVQNKIDFIARSTIPADHNTGRIEMTNAGGSTNKGIMRFYTGDGGGSPLERMTILNNGYIGIGINTPTVTLHIANDIKAVIAAQTYSDINSGGLAIARARGSSGSPQPVSSGDYLGFLSFIGGDETGFSSPSGSIHARAAQVFTSGHHGTDLIFNTTPNDNTTEITRMIISNNGNVAIGTGTISPLYQLQVNGITKTTGITIPAGAFPGAVLVSDTFGNGTWQFRPEGFSNFQVFNTNGTFTLSAGVKKIMIEVWGAGGGGGKGNGACSGGGGGAGGYGKGIFTTTVSSLQVDVGVGGTGGTGSSSGTNGFGSCISTGAACTGTILISATGGLGASSPCSPISNGGNSTASLNISGGDGAASSNSDYSHGGDAPLGGSGGKCGGAGADGGNGIAPGGGGGGGRIFGSTKGGNGAPGRVIIWY